MFPAANVVPRAKAAGARVVIVNGEPTGMDRFADVGAASAPLVGSCRPSSTSVASNPDRSGRLSRMATFRDLLSRRQGRDHRGRHGRPPPTHIAAGAIVLDVREPDEYDQGALPGAVHIPRGHLEAQVEGRIARQDAPVVVYCAGGVRRAFAAKTLQELGYTDVVVDGRRLRQVEGRGPRRGRRRSCSPPTSATATSATCCCPRSASPARPSCSTARCCCSAPAASARPPRCTSPPPASARSASSTWTRSTPRNLQRQILHNLDRIGDRKVDSAKKTLTLLNPDVNVVTYDTRLDASNIMDIIAGYDVIVDGADNFPSRYLLNDASVKLGIPVVHGSIFRFEGMVSVFDPLEGPTYRDMVPEPPPAELAPSCAEAGVLGVLPGIIGSIQALEAIKLLLGLGEPLIGRILSVDTTDMSFRTFNLRKDPANQVTYENRDRIIIHDLEGLCAPGLHD